MSNRQILALPKHANPTQQGRNASAPYNFVPLPETAVRAVERAGDLPSHDGYDSTRHTGFFEVSLTTRSPLYVRCPVTLADFLRQESGQDANLPFRRQVRNTPDFFYTFDPNHPVIPGSSLRGMVRSCLEIVGYGKVQWVTERQLFFRTVDDTAVGRYYRGRMAGKVEAGFFHLGTSGYVIRVCQMVRVPREKLGGTLYEGHAPNKIPRWNGQPCQWLSVWIKLSEKGYLEEVQYSPTPGSREGRLVITGDVPGKKKEFVFLLPNENAEEIPIPGNMIERFQDDDQITQWQERAFPKNRPQPNCRERDGVMRRRPGDPGDPILFLREDGQLTFFGRTQMFRLPYKQCPLDLVPPELRRPEDIDYTEALFGFVRSRKELDDMRQRGLPFPGQGAAARAYAGRVFFSDAVLAEGEIDVWLSADPLVARTLATPKATSFQHYLVQASDNKNTLKHYDSSSPGETVIRGHKLYWHQNANWVSLDDVKNRIAEDREKLAEIARQEAQGNPDTQHTQFRPVRAGVKFRSRIYFENLSNEELGALCWVLHPLGDPNKDYCHSLGMGKPLGMGAVKLEASLLLTDRRKRYRSLFEGDCWQTGLASMEERLFDRTVQEQRTKAFEKHILETLECYPKSQHLYELKRIGMLLKMLEWPGPDPQEAQYMNLEKFKHRPVLPDPSGLGTLTGEAEPTPNPPTQPARIAAERISSPGHASSVLPAASQRERPQTAPKPLRPDSKPSVVTIKKELVTLVENAKGGKALVRTSQDEAIPCSKFPPYPAAEAGMRCRAKVARSDGKAQRATFDRWE